MLSRRLARRGYEVLLAVDGEEGAAVGADGSAGADLDGHEPARHRRLGGHPPPEGDPDTGTIPVIALTAHAMASDRESALAAGCDDFDTKPVEFDRLLAKIEALLGARGAAVSADQTWLAHLRHELRTPLNHIVGYTEMLLEDI